MDLLRSCYKTKMRFYRDDPTRLTKVRWFWSPPGAGWYPHRHNFSSLNYTDNPPPAGSLGEIYGAGRPWYSGMVPGHYLGDHFCGTPDQFENGALSTDDPLPVDRNGEPLCCANEIGGVIVGGQAFNERAVVQLSTGGFLIGGSSPWAALQTGGFLLGGTAPALGKSTQRGLGGFEILGTSPRVVRPRTLTGGGFLLGGTSPRTPKAKYTATGGFLLGGTAPTTPKAKYTATGGFLLGGTAPRTPKAKYTATGGFLLGGTAPRTPKAKYTATGGFLLGGTSPFSSHGAPHFYASSTADGTSVSMSPGIAPSTGDMLILALYAAGSSSAPTFTVPGAWTHFNDYTQGVYRIGVYYLIYSGQTYPWTVSTNGINMESEIFSWSGVSSISTSNSSNGSSIGLSVTTGSVSVTGFKVGIQCFALAENCSALANATGLTGGVDNTFSSGVHCNRGEISAASTGSHGSFTFTVTAAIGIHPNPCIGVILGLSP
jgi:hypothetical protein